MPGSADPFESLLRDEPVVNVLEGAPSTVLREGLADVPLLGRNVRMGDGGRGYEDGGGMRKFDDEAQLPKNKMAALPGVKLAQGRNGTISKGAIHDVPVLIAPYVVPQVKRGGRVY